jgi:hypothetical protein
MSNIFISCIKDPTINQNLIDLQQYYDYTSQWYLDYGFQFTANFMVMILFPHLLAPFAEMALNKFKIYLASKEKIEILINKKL